MKFTALIPRFLGFLFLLLLLFLSYFRFQFWLFNHSFFDSDGLDFLIGLRFDVSLAGYLFLLIIPVYFASYILFGYEKALRVTKGISMLLFALIAFTECWDLAYFQYTLKRCSFELYGFYLGGEEKNQILPWLTHFWYLVLLFGIMNVLFYIGLNRIKPRKEPEETRPFLLVFSGLLTLSLSVGLARNSFDLKPLGILDANVNRTNKNPSLALNSLFVVLKTIQNKELPNYSYLPRSEEAKYFNPTWNFNPTTDSTVRKPNLIFFVIESLGSQQIGKTVNGVVLTPFLDSLNTIHGKNIRGYAEGKTSIEVLPALFAGIPSWQDQPYVLSDYALNQWVGFPQLCNNLGYRTCFFHGASDQSMRFGAVQRSLGFSEAFFSDKITHTAADLGSWGIHDEPMLKAMNNQLKASSKPFMATFFSLSTHEPYDIPPSYLKKFPMLTKEQASYRYLDDALKSFFIKAAKEKWFANSIFVITADHTPVHLDQKATSIQDYYNIPILIFSPNQPSLFLEKLTLGHVDIIPTIASLLHWNLPLYSFGSPYGQDQIRYFNGVFHLWNSDYALHFDEKKQQWSEPKAYHSSTSRIENSVLKQRINRSKMVFFAKLQRFRRDLRNNTCRP